MRILSVAYPMAPVGSNAVGGAEQILSMIDSALTARGHESIVIACEGSVTSGRLLPIARHSGAIIDEIARKNAQQLCLATIEQTLNEQAIDLVHFHGIDFYEYLPRTPCRILATIHLPPGWYPDNALEISANFVSDQQRSSTPLGLNAPVIENGVEISNRPAKIKRKNFVASLGRICPEKNYHAAAAAARRAQRPFILAGALFDYEAHHRYFAEEIQPWLGPYCRFIGPVNRLWKRRLLSQATCVLIPSIVPETSSLVAMEALACGTPIVAFRSGALQTIIDEGRTGFLVDDEFEMADAIESCSTIDPQECWEQARERFSMQRMLKQYFHLYDGVIGNRRQ